MNPVRVAIVGVGNCASSLVQGVEYYKDADPTSTVPGLMHVTFGEYHVKDVQFVAAFDVDDKKVGKDLAEAINASENNTIKIADVPTTGVEVQRGPTLDGIGKYFDPGLLQGRTPEQALLEEKDRADQLRRQVRALSRWRTPALHEARDLYDILIADGLPSRRPRPPAGLRIGPAAW